MVSLKIKKFTLTQQLRHLRDMFVEAKNSSVSHSVFVILVHCSAKAYCNCFRNENLELHVVLVEHCVYNVCQQLVQDCMLF